MMEPHFAGDAAESIADGAAFEPKNSDRVRVGYAQTRERVILGYSRDREIRTAGAWQTRQVGHTIDETLEGP